MSASEKLKALGNEWRDNDIAALQDALPQIVAVVEAAQEANARIYGLEDASWVMLSRALAALEDALS